jgi:hypothetical protein
MENKLISMCDFVLEQSNEVEQSGDFLIFKRSFVKIENYANFLKKPLEKWMFVPCDENGNVLDEPKEYNKWHMEESYQQAKERCYFEGFTFYEHQSTFVNSRNNVFEYCIFNYTPNKLGVCIYSENKGFHTYFQMNTIEDLIQIKKGIKLTATAKKEIGL